MGVSNCGGRSVSRIISVFSGNRMRLVGLDRVPTAEFIRLQEPANAAAPVAPTIRRNPRGSMKLTPTAAMFSAFYLFRFTDPLLPRDLVPDVAECSRALSVETLVLRIERWRVHRIPSPTSVPFLLNLLDLMIFFNARSTDHGQTIAAQQIGSASLLIDELVLYLLDGGERGGACWIRKVHQMVITSLDANIPVMSIAHDH